jgi:type IV secretion system protein VirB8
MSNKNNEKTTEKIINQSISFETSLIHKIKRSEKIAWIVAGCFMVTSLVLAAGYMLIMPLKERVPYLVLANSATGVATLSKIVGAYNTEEISTNEALAKSNVTKFLTARESYDYDLIGRSDWITVHAMAGDDVSRYVLTAYKNLFSSLNPDNLAKTYGRVNSVRIRIKSIILTASSDPKKGYELATVRFDKIVVDKEQDTINFQYNSKLEMPEEMRVHNPLGFVVTGYRVDPDLNASKETLLKEYSNTP